MPDGDKINEKKRLEIVKRQTANQLWSFVIEKAACEEAEFPGFKEVLKSYEEGFPKLLEINKNLLLRGEENEQEN
jgi:hypothetical protein